MWHGLSLLNSLSTFFLIHVRDVSYFEVFGLCIFDLFSYSSFLYKFNSVFLETLK